MDLNYTAFALISFLPIIIGYIWYHPNFLLKKRWGISTINPQELKWFTVLLLLAMSGMLVFGYINLIIHQMGFYELFFTDIMLGSKEAEAIASEFMAKYGEKHRHLGHGIFHGAIIAVGFAGPFVAVNTILDKRSMRYFLYHFLYWFVVSLIIGGLISEFV